MKNYSQKQQLKTFKNCDSTIMLAGKTTDKTYAKTKILKSHKTH